MKNSCSWKQSRPRHEANKIVCSTVLKPISWSTCQYFPPSAVSTYLTPKDVENELSEVRATDWYQLALQHSLQHTHPHTHFPLYLQVDTPTLLNQDLPRAIPGLEEVKVESVKEETQTCGREFQDPPQLVQGRPAYVFAKSFYYSSHVSYGRKISLYV